MHSVVSFLASIHLPSLEQEINVTVNKGQNIKDLVNDLIHTHRIPPYITLSLYTAIISAMLETCQRNTMSMDTRDVQSTRQFFLQSFQENTLQYNNKPEEDIFPRAYHTLVHCPIGSIFDTLLQLEHSDATAIQELQTASEYELMTIQARHMKEAETAAATTPQVNMTTIINRQMEEMELFQATWQSEILQTQKTQRIEYREFVIELYKEYQARIASLSLEQHMESEDMLMMAEKLDGKEIVAAAAGRVQHWNKKEDTTVPSKPRTASLANSLSSIPPSSQPNEQASLVRATSLPPEHTNNQFQRSVSDIQEMGFSKEQAETALILSNQSMENAIALLIDNLDKVDTHIAESKVQQPHPTNPVAPYRRSYSLSQVSRPPPTTSGSVPNLHSRNSSLTESLPARRHSLQRLASTPTINHMIGRHPSHHSKSWNPISFLQQQKQAMENTNLSSVRKLGGWLGKAMENLGIDHEGNERYASENTQQLVESFSTLIGTGQIKSSHNLRLLVTDITTQLFNPMYDAPREMAYRAETATKLYTSHLGAVIVLVELSELKYTHEQHGEGYGWKQYKSGQGSNASLFDRCQQSTEFHFPDIEAQLSTIEQDFRSNPEGLQEGTFFVTKHSNLPSSQVVYHLVIDSSAIVTTDLVNRHPLIAGLRNILKLTTQFDISSLSLPLLLLPDRFLEHPEQHLTLTESPQWMYKRGDVVMKCIKGYLMENSRYGKRLENGGIDRSESMGNGALRNIVFLLPSQVNIYHHLSDSSHNNITQTNANHAPPQDVEMAFQQFRSMLASIFRTS
ncbi:hypothetical protein BDB01DRAFT_848996 [Pilobolus umbonatus]|nr:hypothetical protein BDB01DRAFT_848996 [Pilobolus umbonatus]